MTIENRERYVRIHKRAAIQIKCLETAIGRIQVRRGEIRTSYKIGKNKFEAVLQRLNQQALTAKDPTATLIPLQLLGVSLKELKKQTKSLSMNATALQNEQQFLLAQRNTAKLRVQKVISQIEAIDRAKRDTIDCQREEELVELEGAKRSNDTVGMFAEYPSISTLRDSSSETAVFLKDESVPQEGRGGTQDTSPLQGEVIRSNKAGKPPGIPLREQIMSLPGVSDVVVLTDTNLKEVTFNFETRAHRILSVRVQLLESGTLIITIGTEELNIQRRKQQQRELLQALQKRGFVDVVIRTVERKDNE